MSVIGLFAAPLVSATGLPRVNAASATFPSAAAFTVTVTRLGVHIRMIRSDSMYAAGVRSSQTVCQMPVTAVYQIPFGWSTCLPRG